MIKENLKTSLRSQFDHQLEKGIIDLRHNIAPFRRIIESETNKINYSQNMLEQRLEVTNKLKQKIQNNMEYL